MEWAHLEDRFDGRMVLKGILNKIGQVSVDFAQDCGEFWRYCSCEDGVKHLSCVKNVRNCSSSQLSDHYCLKKDSAAQGLDRHLLFYYFIVKCIFALGTHC
jgi:hypothetical protein